VLVRGLESRSGRYQVVATMDR